MNQPLATNLPRNSVYSSPEKDRKVNYHYSSRILLCYSCGGYFFCPVTASLCFPHGSAIGSVENSAPDEVHSVQDFLQRAHAEMPDARRGTDAMVGVTLWLCQNSY